MSTIIYNLLRKVKIKTYSPNYLDLSIIRQNFDFTDKIYRKDSCSDDIIPFSSDSPIGHTN